MSKVSVIARDARALLIAMVLIACVALTSGCGGGSAGSSSDPPLGGTQPTPPAPAPIEGVATPTSVAVVTATNAQ